MEKIPILDSDLSAEQHNTTAIIHQNSTEQQILLAERTTIDDRISKIEELLRSLSPAPVHTINPNLSTQPKPTAHQLAIINPSITALIASQQLSWPLT